MLLLLAILLAGPALAAPKTAPKPACDRAAFRLILDVGHTTEDPGAIGARGIVEYEFNLRLANLMKQKLADAGFAKTTVLVTAGKAKPALYKRVRDANRMGGDLFISIHHDAVPDWFVEYWEHEGAQRKFSDRFKGHSVFVSNNSSNLAASVRFAKLLGQEMKQRGLHYAKHYTEPFMKTRKRPLVDAETGVYRFDELLVLRTVHMPSVLLEAGNILNREEEIEMGKPERQALIVDAVAEAVETYCAAKPKAVRQATRKPRSTKRSAEESTAPATSADTP